MWVHGRGSSVYWRSDVSDWYWKYARLEQHEKSSCETKYSWLRKDSKVILFPNSLQIFQYVCDRKIPDNVTAFQQGQAVIAKVTEVDYDRKRFLVSLRMKDCYHGDTDIGINLLDDYLKEYSLIKANYERQKGNALFTRSLCVCVCVNVCVNFNIVLMVTQTHSQRMASDPFPASTIDSIQNLTMHTQTLCVNRA